MVRCDEFYEKWKRCGNFCEKHEKTADEIDKYLTFIEGLEEGEQRAFAPFSARTLRPLINEKDTEIKGKAIITIKKSLNSGKDLVTGKITKNLPTEAKIKTLITKIKKEEIPATDSDKLDKEPVEVEAGEEGGERLTALPSEAKEEEQPPISQTNEEESLSTTKNSDEVDTGLPQNATEPLDLKDGVATEEDVKVIKETGGDTSPEFEEEVKVEIIDGEIESTMIFKIDSDKRRKFFQICKDGEANPFNVLRNYIDDVILEVEREGTKMTIGGIPNDQEGTGFTFKKLPNDQEDTVDFEGKKMDINDYYEMLKNKSRDKKIENEKALFAMVGLNITQNEKGEIIILPGN